MKTSLLLALGLGLASLVSTRSVSASVVVNTDRVLPANDASFDGQDVVVDHATLTVSGTHGFLHLQLLNGAVLTHERADSGQPEHAVRLTISGNLTVDAVSRIDATGQGYLIAGSPGAGGHGAWSGGGGGFGGNGNVGGGDPGGPGGRAFGSIYAPDSWGGSGGNGDSDNRIAGGGLIHIEAGGTIRIDGAVRADGGAGVLNNSGGGAGGTIYLACALLTGSGTISANGAGGEWVDGGGGAGGRIALLFSQNGFTGGLSAVGGGGASVGGAGTIYLKPAAGVGEVRIGNTGWGEWTPVVTPSRIDLTVMGYGIVDGVEPLLVGNLWVRTNGVLTHATGSTGLVVRASGNIFVEGNGAISADSRGYPIGDNPGPGTGKALSWGGSGAGHGGLGGPSGSGAVGGGQYGSILEPTALGSQGGTGSSGPGTAGGGAIRLIVDGTLTLHGRVSANGAGSPVNNAGGGAGGSIWITAGKLDGDGAITANGAAGEWVDGGGGSGGRIALYYGETQFNGAITALGGGGSATGGAGTIYLRRTSESQGTLVVDNGGNQGNYTPLTSPEAFVLQLSGRAYTYAETALTVLKLDLLGDSILTHLSGQTNSNVHVLGDATIVQGAQFNVDARGFPLGADRGPGSGRQADWGGAGGSHGGLGGGSRSGALATVVYDSILEPILMGSEGGDGSGGAGTPGGGAIRLVVDGKLTVDGRLSADGGGNPPDNVGGGAGGSLWLTVGSLSGAGSISANGGPGEWVDGGGGSGGRIAIYYGTSDFKGTWTAVGGGGAQRGGAGTIYSRKTGTAFGQLLIDNGAAWGNTTPITSPEAFQVTVSGNAVVFPQMAIVLQDLEINENAILTHVPGAVCDVQVLNGATVRAGGRIQVDGCGYPNGTDLGPGTGQRADWGGGGAGHGGSGGQAATGGAGGGVYGSIVEPLTLGSAGANGSGGAGGAGGGVIHLVVANQLRVDGRVTANGNDGTADNSGGGSGGSIFLVTGTLAGAGVISVNGGSGEWVDGGGGGGGRIALHVGKTSFTGDVQSRGGGGHEHGGSGTIYTRTGGEVGGEMVLENGGNAGSLSPFAVPPLTRLVLSGGTTVYPTGSLELASLTLKPGALLTHIIGQPNLTVHVSGDAAVQAGAAITVDGKGYPVDQDRGPGAGDRLDCCGSGAGHGGEGGQSGTRRAGGGGYDSVMEPTAFGSQGGDGSGGPGGAGGGAIRLMIDGALDVNGTVTANGLNGTPDNAGGGSGGSVWITAGTLTGTGTIRADGGAGEWVDGGGGAGGRIALHVRDDQFKGALTARGSGGAQTGGAGTLYTRLGGQSSGRLVIENGGAWGAFTALANEEPFDLTVSASAQVYGQSSLVLEQLDLQTNAALSHMKGQNGLNLIVLNNAQINGFVNVDGRGYPVGSDSGPGAGLSSGPFGSGAGHGGIGGTSGNGMTGGDQYGSKLEPTLPGSQGGSGSGGPGGDGGGAVRMVVGETLTLNGNITANGLNASTDNSGGGSGGSIFLSARSLAGVGKIEAKGGAGEWVDGGGGAGGRIAFYRLESAFAGTVSVSGGGGAHAGSDGTVYEASAPTVVWLAPADEWLSGTISLETAMFVGGTPAVVVFDLIRGDSVMRLASVAAGLTATASWDSTGVPDGQGVLQATVQDASGAVLAQSSRSIAVNNAVIWHHGTLSADATWGPSQVHVVAGDLQILANVHLLIQPGTIVKFVSGGRLTLWSGGTVNASGTSAAPVVLTSFADDSVGGDSNLDADRSKPVVGSWRLAQAPGSTLTLNASTLLRYHSQTYGGTLTASETWMADSLHLVTEALVVPSGMVLSFQAGAVVKFESGQGITIQKGGTLEVHGSAAQPVVFTSSRDDAFGGDSNEDGTRTAPAAGDWRSLRFEDGSTGTMDHAMIRFGGNSVGNPWGAGGVIEALGGPLTVRNSLIAEALKDGAFCYGSTRFENCVVLRCDRGLTAVGTLEAVNCTLDNNRIAALEHVGQLILRNCIVAHSIDSGVSHDLGGSTPIVTYCNVWNPTARQGNYAGTDDRTGRNGNLSAEPRFRNYASDDFRLSYASPGIDAADGEVAPATDCGGSPRYDDPRTSNTGTVADNGSVPDIGAFEFVENAPANIDLIVAEVTGAASPRAGSLAHVAWTIVNRGTEPVTGPWHDSISLRAVDSAIALAVPDVLVGKGATLGPGQTWTAEADIRVPGGPVGEYRWTVVANSQGDLFEGANAANNMGSAAVTSSLGMPNLVVDGAAVQDAFNAQEEEHWFQCVAPAGKDIRFDLGVAATGATELYVGRGFVPTTGNYTARQREWNSAATSAVASGGGTPTGPGGNNVFYVMARGVGLGQTPAGFNIRAASAPFAVNALAPAKVGNASLATIEIRGSGFTADTRFSVELGAQRREALRQTVREAGRAFATFDLAGFSTGHADVVGIVQGLSARLSAGLEITAGGAPEFYATLNGPKTARAGRMTTWFITYGNRGLVDGTLPVLRFDAPGAAEIRLFDSTLNWTDSVLFLGLNPEVLLPTLGPGQEVTVEVRVRSLQGFQARLGMITGEEFVGSTAPLDFGWLPAPAGVSANVWTAYLQDLPARLGSNVGQFAALLLRDLDELRASPLEYSYVANVLGRWQLGDEFHGVSVPRPLLDVPSGVPAVSGQVARPQGLSGLSKRPGDGIHKTWFVVITDEDYTGIKAQSLPGTAKDFADVMQYLRVNLRVPSGQITGAHDGPGDGAWTPQFVLNEIKKFAGQVDGDDNLVVVFSGHGGRQNNGSPFVCLNYGFLSPSDFTHAIDQIGAGTTYFVNDSCHSQAFNEAVAPTNTTFVGFAATMSNRISYDTASGGELITGLKGQLRKCHSLADSFTLTEDTVTRSYENEPKEQDRQHPVLSNVSKADLSGKPWSDPAGFEQELDRALRALTVHPIAEGTLNIVGSVDPNDKNPLSGAGSEHWVQPDQVLEYEILFENKSTALAPAQEVLVTDQLDGKLDWSTFEFKSIGFNNTLVEMPAGLQHFSTVATVATDPNPVVVNADLDTQTGEVSWRFWSQDPMTGQLPEDPFAGFLPPNDASHRGEGVLSYAVRTKAGLADATQLTNQAVIIFDPSAGANPPIVTPIVTNVIDSLAPSSQVQPLPNQVSGDFLVSWSGAGPGIASYDIYASCKGQPFELWQVALTNTSALFSGEPGFSYAFYSIARDLAGNTEPAPSTADARTTVAGGTTYAAWVALQKLPANASGPNEDPDADGLVNLVEYALGTDPKTADAHGSAVRGSIQEFLGDRYLCLTYRRPKTEPSDLIYRVTWSSAVGPWAGQVTPVVLGPPVDRGSFVEITVRAAQPVGATPNGFLTLEVQK